MPPAVEVKTGSWQNQFLTMQIQIKSSGDHFAIHCPPSIHMCDFDIFLTWNTLKISNEVQQIDLIQGSTPRVLS